jgi:hypothetical protein
MELNDFKCSFCNKNYKNYKSLWKHKYIYHKNDSPQNTQNTQNNTVSGISQNNSINSCKFCKKILSRKDNLIRHENTCKKKTDNKETDIIKKLEKELSEIKELIKTIKIHPKTLEKMNKELVNTNTGNINNGNGNINTTNNTTNNIINIIPLGKENLNEIFTDTQKLNILKAGEKAHIALTEFIYQTPEYKKLRNIYITNLQNNTGYIYDTKQNQYIIKSKNEIINHYSRERFWNIEAFLEKVKDELDEKEVDKINHLIKDYFNDDNFNKKKKSELLITLYNNKAQVKELYELKL